MAFSTFHVTQFLLPLPALGFATMLSIFTNIGVKPATANMHSAFQ